MKIKLSQKLIKERCGIVSYKKGDAFYRNDKVTIKEYDDKRYEATVTGKEIFYVTVEQDKSQRLHTTCSCPKLSSFEKDCQHIAAVLLAIDDKQRQKVLKVKEQINKSEAADINMKLADGLLELIHHTPIRKSGHQTYFENREVIDMTFICNIFTDANDSHHIGIELMIGNHIVKNIGEFLEHVYHGKEAAISPTMKFDPALHCFLQENDMLVNELWQLIRDEKINDSILSDDKGTQRMVSIPPSFWEKLAPLLLKAPSVKLSYKGKVMDQFSIIENQLPLQFVFADADNGYELKIAGLGKLLLMNDYQLVLYNDKLINLKRDKMDQLRKLKQMLAVSQMDRIFISEDYIQDFLQEGHSGLKQLGNVYLTKRLRMQMMKTPLVAKLFLDRIRNRLLAGLEFHYDRIVINPLEEMDGKEYTMVIRDIEKEKAILQIMDDSSFTKTEEGYYFHNEDLEYEFLHYAVPKLQKLLQVYATTAVRNRIAKVKTPPKIRIKQKKERMNWLEFKFDMDGIPQREIPELLSALEVKRKYYRLGNGSLLSLETKEFEEIQRFLHAAPVQDIDLENGLNLPIISGMKLLDSFDDPSAFSIEASFRKFLENIEHHDNETFKVPENLEAVLRDYQKQGFHWLKQLAEYGFGGILADDMGLGKTIQSIAYIVSELTELRKNGERILIICPSSLMYNWLNELMKFASEIEAIVIDGNKTERSRLLRNLQGIDVVITSYHLLRSDISLYEQQQFHTVFFDEAQAFKNPYTQTARAVKKLKSDHYFALTGTPLENSMEELWSIFHVVFPELFGGLKEYSNLTRKQVSRRIRPFLLRRMKGDVIKELPEKLELIESIELLPEQKKLYAAYLAKLRHDTFKHLDKGTFRKNKIKILAGLTRLRQICCHPALFVENYEGSSAKFEQLLTILEESRSSGRRVLIFSQFTKMLDLISRALVERDFPYFYLDGQTPSKERVMLCNQFNAGERDIFLISLKAGGTGLNLTGADTVILYDLWWNPAVEQQAADRAHRMGQERVVEVIKLITKGTIEEKMNELQEKKQKLIDEIIEIDEEETSSITEENIREILKI